MSKSNHAVPALAGWNTYAGGTFAAPGKHSYDFYTGPIREGGRQYSISPYTTDHGHHAGYRLFVFPGGSDSLRGHTGIARDGGEVSTHSIECRHRSPQAAASAARKHAAKYGAKTRGR